MLLKRQIENIIDSQRHSLLEKNVGLTREILQTIPIIDGFATVITGIRRCGKSTLMQQLMNQLKSEFVYLNFEDTRLISFEHADFARLSEIISEIKCKTLFFDEIQLAEKWEVFVRQKLDEGFRVFVTGSNATLLSRELGTTLTGRHLNVELFPFSFSEFLRFKEVDPSSETMQSYLHSGGFPEYLKSNDGRILNQLMEDILVRDIAVRYGVRDVSALKQLAVYLVSNIGKPVSGNSLTGIFGVKAKSTILEYMSYLENCYLFQFMPIHSYSLKAQIRNPKKVYTIDNGLFTENSIIFSDEYGRRLENMVFTHMRRKYKQLFFYKVKGECDFVGFEIKGKLKLVQVCYELNDLNLSRELKGLTEAMDFFKINAGTIVTIAQNENLDQAGKKIRVLPAHEYFME